MDGDVQVFNSLEAAKILGVNVSTIKRWTDEGKLNCIRTAGGHRKFQMQHLAGFLEANRKKTTKVNLFPIENETDLKISQHILKGNFNALINLVEKHALMSNRDQLQKILNGLYLAQFPLHVIYDRLITPVLYQVGKRWEEDSLTIIQEHLVSQAIKDSVVRLQGIIQIPRKKSSKVFLLNLSSELHDIALKMVDHILELRGFKVLYTGQLTPGLETDQILQKSKPDRIYLSSTWVEDLAATQAEFNQICDFAQDISASVYIGGAGFNQLNFEHPSVARRLFTFEDVFMI